MPKQFKKENGKLKKTETQTVEAEYSRAEIVRRLENIQAQRADLNARYAQSTSDLNSEEEVYEELLEKADELNVE